MYPEAYSKTFASSFKSVLIFEDAGFSEACLEESQLADGEKSFDSLPDRAITQIVMPLKVCPKWNKSGNSNVNESRHGILA